jgi:riboflavin synthase alpha subunit
LNTGVHGYHRYSTSPSPVNLEVAILINVKKREHIVRGDVEHVGLQKVAPEELYRRLQAGDVISSSLSE